MRNVSRLAFGFVITFALITTARAEIITYDVNMHFDPTGSGLGPMGVGTVTGTITIDTSIPASTGSDPGNVVAVDLTESSNDGVLLSGFGTMFTSQQFTDLNFINSETEFANGQIYEFVSLTSLPYFDGTLIGPAFQFDFPFPVGGDVLSGNFDSITGPGDYLYGTVLPQTSSSVPEPSSMGLLGFGALGLLAEYRRRRVAAC